MVCNKKVKKITYVIFMGKEKRSKNFKLPKALAAAVSAVL